MPDTFRCIDVFLARALNAASSGIALADATVTGFPLTFVNESFELLTGYSAADCLGRNCKFLQTADTDFSVTTAIGEALRDGRDFHGTLLNERRDGSRFHNELRLTIVRDPSGRAVQVLGVQNDVTALVEGRHTLERERDEAQAEVQRLLHEALSAEERARKQLAQIVHDDGLQHLMAASQDLAELELPAETNGPLIDAQDHIRHAIDHLRGALHGMGPVALFADDSLGDALRLVCERLARSGRFALELEVDPAAGGVADEDVIAVVRELVTNAGRHARPRRVTVAVRLVGEGIELYVADDGVGIASGEIERARREGHIGLALARERAIARGGTWALESAPGGGVRVAVRLPR